MMIEAAALILASAPAAPAQGVAEAYIFDDRVASIEDMNGGQRKIVRAFEAKLKEYERLDGRIRFYFFNRFTKTAHVALAGSTRSSNPRNRVRANRPVEVELWFPGAYRVSSMNYFPRLLSHDADGNIPYPVYTYSIEQNKIVPEAY